ncbi:MAG: DUF624 domain-containing protein [Bacilli bacterium]|nr:DUF624 domain-containing protein [Bacilli bacterium]
MGNVDFDQRLNSKPYRFFDLIYRLLVINVLSIILSVTVIGLFPGIVAATATLKEGSVTNVFKQYFKNFLKYFKKAFLVGLILFILYFLAGYAFYFYAMAEVEGGTWDPTVVFKHAGLFFSLLALIVITFFSVHLPLLIVTLQSLTVGEIYRTGFYITFRYFLTTLILFALQALIIVTFIFCVIDFRVLAIWMLIGISLPIYLQVKVTAPVYYKLSQIDFEKIMHQVDEDEEEENE